MTLRMLRKAAGLLAAVCGLGLGTVGAQQNDRLTVFAQPIPLWDSVWVADAKGYYKDEGLDVQFRMFPSGTVALQTFRTGEGDLNFGGDFPGVSFWQNNDKKYRIISALTRDSKGYLVTARKNIKTAQDLKGKIVATTVGSTGSYFVASYLEKNGMSTSDVTLKNLDTQVMPTALCKGDIDAFFIFQPFGARAIQICPNDVYNMSTGEGYINGYAVVAARPDWLDDPRNRDKARRFLKATLKGAKEAEKNLAFVQSVMKSRFGLTEDIVKSQWELNERVVGIDKTFYQDFCALTSWMAREKILKIDFNFNEFVDGRPIAAVEKERFDPIPAKC